MGDRNHGLNLAGLLAFGIAAWFLYMEVFAKSRENFLSANQAFEVRSTARR